LSKRESQIILKTEERDLLLALGCEEKFNAKSVSWAKTEFSSRSRTPLGCFTHLPAGRGEAAELLRPTFWTTETALQPWFY
jgi:hypothetical protein